MITWLIDGKINRILINSRSPNSAPWKRPDLTLKHYHVQSQAGARFSLRVSITSTTHAQARTVSGCTLHTGCATSVLISTSHVENVFHVWFLPGILPQGLGFSCPPVQGQGVWLTCASTHSAPSTHIILFLCVCVCAFSTSAAQWVFSSKSHGSAFPPTCLLLGLFPW